MNAELQKAVGEGTSRPYPPPADLSYDEVFPTLCEEKPSWGNQWNHRMTRSRNGSISGTVGKGMKHPGPSKPQDGESRKGGVPGAGPKGVRRLGPAEPQDGEVFSRRHCWSSWKQREAPRASGTTGGSTSVAVPTGMTLPRPSEPLDGEVLSTLPEQEASPEQWSAACGVLGKRNHRMMRCLPPSPRREPLSGNDLAGAGEWATFRAGVMRDSQATSEDHSLTVPAAGRERNVSLDPVQHQRTCVCTRGELSSSSSFHSATPRPQKLMGQPQKNGRAAHPEDEVMDMRDVPEDPPPEEKDENAHIPWIEVIQAGHVARKPKTLTLPADDYKLAIRPRNGLQLSKVSPMHLRKAIAREATLNSINKLAVGSNTFEVSSIGVSPDNSCKGVIYNIGLNYTPKEVQDAIVAPNHELLTCKRMGNTGPFLLTFKGKKWATEADVCPNQPKTPKCKTCGSALSSNQHEVPPKVPSLHRRPHHSVQGVPTAVPASCESAEARATRTTPVPDPKRGEAAPDDQAGVGVAARCCSESKSRASFRGRSSSGKRGNREGSQNSQTSLHQASWARIVYPKAYNSHTPTEERLLDENAMLRAEIAAMRAGVVAMKEELNNYRKASNSVNAQIPSPEQRKRAVIIPPQAAENPSQPKNLLQPDNTSNIIFPQYAMEEQAQGNVARAVNALQAAQSAQSLQIMETLKKITSHLTRLQGRVDALKEADFNARTRKTTKTDNANPTCLSSPMNHPPI
ncbi:hypothetical protein HPB48_009571 [Haemaphysalis longicornis]|uniref:Uncharacterized protein n=1 Tax=Haemaphysalis longicornis TaxID=44386 RepID=A0A9J6FBS0_HAELO|nr:hypothetical protein HPB48_009571 [Haemaphysalis longicornis]